jgi:transcriptional regulator with XRE-family HTH domain
LTQKDLAKLIGTKQSNISRFESGSYNPSLEFLNKIAQAMGKELQIRIV